MLEWEGWRYDESAGRLLAPREVRFSPVCRKVFEALLRAEGATVDFAALEAAIDGFWTKTAVSGVRTSVNGLRVAVRRPDLILNVFAIGFRLSVATGPNPDVLYRVAKILEETFETGPAHARIVAAQIAVEFK